MGKLGLISAEPYDEQGYDAPLAMDAEGGKGTLSEYSLQDDRLKITVQGTFLRLRDYMNKPKLAEEATPVPVTISRQVDLPPHIE